MVRMPVIEHNEGRPFLSVGGEPFLALGVQWDFRNTIAPERSEFLYAHAAAMNCTTAFVPVLWSQVEPERDRYDFGFIDRQLALAARHGLKLSLLWFGSNRGGSMRFKNKHYPSEDAAEYTYQVPSYIVADRDTYRRSCTPDGRIHESLCPTCGATLAREKAAFRAALRHLAEADTARTVILMQVENEISTPDSRRLDFPPRCCCPVCDEAFARSGLGEREFGDRSYGDYVTSLVEAGAEIYPLPFYVNFVGTPRPGEDISYYLEKAPHLTSCAPDIYALDTEGFRRNLAAFAVGRNVPLVAETSSDTKDPAERNVYYALLEGGAIAYDLWAIDCAYGFGAWEEGYAHRTPLVDREGRWSAKAYQIKAEFGVLRRAMAPLLEHRLTGRLQWFVGEGKARRLPLTLPGLAGEIDSAPDGCGFVILRGPGDLTLAGHGFSLRLDKVNGDMTALAGGWLNDRFIPDAGPVELNVLGDGIELDAAEHTVVRLCWRAG